MKAIIFIIAAYIAYYPAKIIAAILYVKYKKNKNNK